MNKHKKQISNKSAALFYLFENLIFILPGSMLLFWIIKIFSINFGMRS